VALIGVVTAETIVRISAPGLSAAGIQVGAAAARLLFLMVPVSAAAEVLRSLMNAYRAPVLAAAMPIAMSGTTAILVATVAGGSIEGVAQAFVVGAIVQLLLMIVLTMTRGLRYRPGWPFRTPEVQRLGRLSVRPVASSGVQLLTRLGEQFFMSFMPAGSITLVTYGNQLIGSIGGRVFFRSVVVVLLPRLTEAAAENDRRTFGNITRAGARLVLAFSLPLTAFLVVLAGPGAFLVFRRGNFSATDTRLLALVLAVYSVSLIGAALQRVLLATFLAHLNTRVQLRNTVYGALVNLALIFPLAMLLGGDQPRAVLAVPVAYNCAQVVNVVHAWVRMRRDLGISLDGLGRFALRLTSASLSAFGAMLITSSVVGLSGGDTALELGLRGSIVASVGAVVLGAAVALLLREDVRRSWATMRAARGTSPKVGGLPDDEPPMADA
jgi:putative peptidoglycan lipid II flippase